jgi:hypothetical protein
MITRFPTDHETRIESPGRTSHFSLFARHYHVIRYFPGKAGPWNVGQRGRRLQARAGSKNFVVGFREPVADEQIPITLMPGHVKRKVDREIVVQFV